MPGIIRSFPRTREPSLCHKTWVPAFAGTNGAAQSEMKLPCAETKRSHPLDKTIHHALLAGLVERDGQLVAVDEFHVAVAEFLVKHAVAG